MELLEQMDNALLSVPLDSEEYKRKAEALSILHQYVEGTYTIFPEKKQAVEIADSELGQLSIFDFIEQEPQAKEQSTAAAVEVTPKGKSRCAVSVNGDDAGGIYRGYCNSAIS